MQRPGGSDVPRSLFLLLTLLQQTPLPLYVFGQKTEGQGRGGITLACFCPRRGLRCQSLAFPPTFFVCLF